MATTKKSPKAKTNTKKPTKNPKTPVQKSVTKRPAIKTAAAKAKRVPAKVKVAKTTTVKAIAKKPVAVAVGDKLRKLNQVSAFVHVVGAIAAAVLMGNMSLQIFTGLTAKDQLASTGSTVFVPAIHHLYDLELRWVVVTLLLLGAVVPLINVFKANRYKAAVAVRNNSLRWLDMAVLSGIMLATVAALSGVQDFMTLKLVVGLIVITAALGWLAERQNSDPRAVSDKSAYTISLLSGILPWLLVLAYAFGTPLWGMIRYPWYVYALYAAVFIGSAAYAINGYNYVRRFRNFANYAKLERNYLVINILTRVSFAAILIVGLSK